VSAKDAPIARRGIASLAESAERMSLAMSRARSLKRLDMWDDRRDYIDCYAAVRGNTWASRHLGALRWEDQNR
jgi:hypothetical protein